MIPDDFQFDITSLNAPTGKKLAKEWEFREISTQSLSPGTALHSDQLFEEASHDIGSAMCSYDCERWMAKAFGPAHGHVEGRYGKSKFRAFHFGERTILSFAEARRGVSWQILHGAASDETQGRHYGKAILISCDAECVDFWPKFCAQFGNALGCDPEALRAHLEKKSLNRATPVSAALPAPSKRM